MSKKSFSPTIPIVLGLMFIAVIGLRTVSTPEIWTHLAQGRSNLPLSFLPEDNGINTTWLYDLFAYQFYKIGGAGLLTILNIIGLLGTFILLMLSSKKWGGPLSQGFALLIAGHLMFQSIDVGPQVIMILFIALTLYLATTLQKQAILYATLIPLEVLWANMHGSFIYGPIIVGLAAVQIAQQNKSAGRARSKKGLQPSTFAILAVAMLVATFINPALYKLHGQVVANLTNGAPSYWSSIFVDYFQIPPLKPLIFFVIVLCASGLITLKKRLPWTLTGMAIYSAFIIIGPQSRMYLLFAVLTFPFMVLSLTAISEYIHSSLKNLLGKKAQMLPTATLAVLVVLIVLSIIPIVNNCAYAKTGSASRFGLGMQEELYPNGADELIGNPLFPEKAINLAADGGYLAFRHPDRKIFIDYRSGRYSKDMLNDLNSLMVGDREAYNSVIEAYRPEAFIINTLYPSSAQGIVTLLNMRYEARRVWRLAYFDGTTAILLINTEANLPLIENEEIQQAGLEQLEAALEQYAAKNSACTAGNPAELIGSGKVYLALNRPAESEYIFYLLLQGNRKIPAAWIGLGESQLLNKKFDDAISSLKTATEMAPNNPKAWESYAKANLVYANRTDDDAKETELRAEAERAISKLDSIRQEQLKEFEKKQKEQSKPDTTIPQPKKTGLGDLVNPDNL
ncbi:MAG: hypothetical protein JXR25_14510 [Pontiellaceae bacterium]|nr:hypothetical protein [Pontiellaceae bacterium]MBN2786032.1 hypothetical protein [Pontiellaceae bacterium]